MSHSPHNRLSYRDAGVDIDRGHDLVARIRAIADRTPREGVIAGLGGFGALFEPPFERYRQPVLVSGTDGVGTKIKLAIAHDRHDTIGIDLVAMCVNDIVAQGAEPMFFLDYFATGRLDVDVAERVVAGIARGCALAGAALVGGETAEMPGMYADGDYDLAGFCVGIVERSAIIDGARVAPGDRVVAIASSGPHSNGYSLIRSVLDASGEDLDRNVAGTRLVDALLAPTRIYAPSVLPLTRDGEVHAIAHVTGGGIVENLPRVLPAGNARDRRCVELAPSRDLRVDPGHRRSCRGRDVAHLQLRRRNAAGRRARRGRQPPRRTRSDRRACVGGRPDRRGRRQTRGAHRVTARLMNPGLRIVVLISGRGTNLKAIIDAVASGVFARRARGRHLQRAGCARHGAGAAGRT